MALWRKETCNLIHCLSDPLAGVTPFVSVCDDWPCTMIGLPMCTMIGLPMMVGLPMWWLVDDYWFANVYDDWFANDGWFANVMFGLPMSWLVCHDWSAKVYDDWFANHRTRWSSCTVIHMSYMNESCHACQRVMSRVNESLHTWMSRGTYDDLQTTKARYMLANPERTLEWGNHH